MDLTAAVAAAIRRSPCPQARLAREAGVSPTLLSLIKSGVRPATPEIAARIAGALERWGAECAQAARRIRRANRGHRARRAR